MQLVGLANTRISTGYVKKSPLSLEVCELVSAYQRMDNKKTCLSKRFGVRVQYLMTILGSTVCIYIYICFGWGEIDVTI